MVALTIPKISKIMCYDTQQKIKVTRVASINGTTKLEIPNVDYNQSFVIIDPLQKKAPLISGSGGLQIPPHYDVLLNRPLKINFQIAKEPLTGVCISKGSNHYTIETPSSLEIVSKHQIQSISYFKEDTLSSTSTIITIFGNGSRDVEISYFIHKDPQLRIEHQIGFKTSTSKDDDNNNNKNRHSIHLISYITWECIEKFDYPIKLVFMINNRPYKIDNFVANYLEHTKNEIVRLQTEVEKVMVYNDFKLEGQAFLLQNTTNVYIPLGKMNIEGAPNTSVSYMLECPPNEHCIVYAPPIIGSNLSTHKPDLFVKKTTTLSPIRIPQLSYSKKLSVLSLEAEVSVSFLFANMTDTDYNIVVRSDKIILPSECTSILTQGDIILANNNATKLNSKNPLYLFDLPQLESKTLTFKGDRKGTRTINQQINLTAFKFMQRLFESVNQPNRDEFEVTKIIVDDKEEQDILYECFKHMYSLLETRQPNSGHGYNRHGFNFATPFGANANANTNTNTNTASLFGAQQAPQQNVFAKPASSVFGGDLGFGQQSTKTYVETSSANSDFVDYQDLTQYSSSGVGHPSSFPPSTQPPPTSNWGTGSFTFPSTTNSSFGTASSVAGGFGTTTSTSSGFGSGLFGASTSTTSSGFGTTTSTPFGASTSTTSPFGATTTYPQHRGPYEVLGDTSPTCTAVPAGGLFGTPTTPTTGLFGTPTTTTAPTAGLFVTPTTATAPTTGLFGTPTTTTAPTTGFGRPIEVVVAQPIELQGLSLEESRLKHNLNQQ